MSTDRKTYDATTIAFHWIIGIGIILLAGTELIRHEFPKGSFVREGLKPLHQPLGTILFGLILLRIAYRVLVRVRVFDTKPGLSERAASAMHVLLYALMILMPLLGLVSVLGRDRPIDFGLFSLVVPLKAYIGGLAREAREVHEFLGVSILVIAGLHAAAALFHHYVLGDGVLRQMLPHRRQRADRSARAS